MKINSNHIITPKVSISNEAKMSTIFDLDVKLNRSALEERVSNQLITSKSLCTPGCGNTGSGNSFCC